MNTKVIQSTETMPIHVLGVPHIILVEKQDSISGYELVKISGDVGAGVPPHRQTHEDITFYVLSGEIVITVDDKTVIGTVGTTVHAPRGVAQSFQMNAPNSSMLLVIAPGNLAPMFRQLAELPAGELDLEAVMGICAQYDVVFVS